MAIDVSMMQGFSAITEASNRIVNLSPNNGEDLTSAGTFKGWNVLRVPLRSSAEKAANNAVRTALLESLCRTFGVTGRMVDCMEALRNRLGDDVLKSADFALDGKGRVTSGKPLTERRIAAIMTRVNELVDQAYAGRVALMRAAIRQDPDLVQKEVFRPVIDLLDRPVTVRLPPDADHPEGRTASLPVYSDRKYRQMDKVRNIFLPNLLLAGVPKLKEKNEAMTGVIDTGGRLAPPFYPKSGNVVNAAGQTVDGFTFLHDLLRETFDALVDRFCDAHPEFRPS